MIRSSLHNQRGGKILGFLLAGFGPVILLLWFDLGYLAAKWIVYIFAGLLVGVIAVICGDVRKTFLLFFVFGLQIGVTFYLTEPTTRWVGSSGPTALAIQFGTIPAAILLLLHILREIGNYRRRFLWGKEISYPAALVFLTSALTIFYTSERMLVVYYLFDLLQLYMVFLVILNTVRSRDDIGLIINMLMITLAIQCLIYFIQNAIGVTFTLTGETLAREARPGGTVSTRPATFASFLLPLLLIAVSRYLTSGDRRVRLWMGLCSAMGVSALILTLTRAAWAGFALGSVWLVAIGVKQQIIKPRRCATFLVAAIVLITLLSPMYAARLFSDHEGAYYERSSLMGMAWNVIKENPVLGVGSGAYSGEFLKYLMADLGGEWLFVVHNVYLLRWAETGIFGLSSLLMLLSVGLRQALICIHTRDQTTSSLALGWSAGLIALIWEMWWDIALGFPASSLVWFMFGLMLVVKRIGLNDNAPLRQRRVANWSMAPSREGAVQ